MTGVVTQCAISIFGIVRFGIGVEVLGVYLELFVGVFEIHNSVVIVVAKRTLETGENGGDHGRRAKGEPPYPSSGRC